MVVVSPTLCSLLSWVVDVGAITLGPFIVCRTEPSPRTLNHERIHQRQQYELLLLGFVILYVGSWLWNLVSGLVHLHRFDGYVAYMQIPFEREAYEHEAEPEYLTGRKLFAWARK
jgi:hypothetical protein